MKSVSFRERQKSLYGKAVVSVGWLALFLLIAATYLVSQSIGSSFRCYFDGVNSLRKTDSESIDIVEPFVGEKSNVTLSADHGFKLDESGEGESKGTLRERAKNEASKAECDLYHGKWIHDETGALYRNDTCPIILETENCQGNGRPDKDYENWRWQPSECHLPRFDPNKFLELVTGKTLAFIGDSVARNQMESLVCIMWQFEDLESIGDTKAPRYFLRSASTTIVFIWSAWLVHQTSEPFDYAPGNMTKVHLDAPDESFMEHITEFDVIVISSGHWYAKPSVFILNNEIVGAVYWWPDKSRKMKVDNIKAFGISMETAFTAIATHPNYTGVTIVRSYSPDHYETGTWNTGGSCTGKVRPVAVEGELVKNTFTNAMYKKQVNGFNRAVERKTNKSKLRLMDITEAFSYRHDGHPGPYRSLDPNKRTKRGPDGKPPPQDCVHWCMPGPVDTWNEMLFQLIKREFWDKE